MGAWNTAIHVLLSASAPSERPRSLAPTDSRMRQYFGDRDVERAYSDHATPSFADWTPTYSEHQNSIFWSSVVTLKMHSAKSRRGDRLGRSSPRMVPALKLAS